MTSPFQQGDKVVAYCRYSEGDEQGLKNTSTEEQADAIRKFCDENRLQLVTIYSAPSRYYIATHNFWKPYVFYNKKNGCQFFPI